MASKIWQVCDLTTSYIANFEPYLGVKYKTTIEGRRKETGTIKEDNTPVATALPEKNHIFFCDSLFTSVNTALELQDKKVYMVGSFSRRNRKTMPPQLIPEGKSKKLKLKIGEMKAATRPDNTINITAYQDDSAQILILNTVYPPLATSAEAVDDERHVPVSLQCYRHHMGGVDRSNQRRKYYHTGRKNNRWWIYMACYLIDVALVNAYECFKALNRTTKVTHKFFNIRTGKQLIGGHSSRIQKSIREVGSLPSNTSFIRSENMDSHEICRLSGRQKSCKQCSKDGRKTASGRLSETSKGCPICKVHLHAGECFAAFHHNMALRGKRTVGTQTRSTEEQPSTSGRRMGAARRGGRLRKAYNK
uniref:PiggyBac transposable element-derived protein 3-like n=1 Tax=Saccoglossus kowalevskii TaxID=10224 RepID=A0ABM0MXI7_SACKO|nr:PREDICTED: piggyBac transposable element-derived protein 3-like [Saccoglossus kowalevskii]